jgi:hypothetical protein
MHGSLRLRKPNLGGGYSKQLRSTSSDCDHHFDQGVCALALGVNEDLTRDNHGLIPKFEFVGAYLRRYGATTASCAHIFRL